MSAPHGLHVYKIGAVWDGARDRHGNLLARERFRGRGAKASRDGVVSAAKDCFAVGGW